MKTVIFVQQGAMAIEDLNKLENLGVEVVFYHPGFEPPIITKVDDDDSR